MGKQRTTVIGKGLIIRGMRNIFSVVATEQEKNKANEGKPIFIILSLHNHLWRRNPFPILIALSV